MPPKRLADIAAAREYLNATQLAKALGVANSFASHLLGGNFAPNHPIVPKLAELLGLSVPEVQHFARREEMTPSRVSQSLSRLGKSFPRQGGTRTALVTTRRPERPAQRNTLLRMDKVARQTARSLAMQASLCAMDGKKYMDVAVPVEGMATILNDWFRLKGIAKQVVVDVDYEEVFG